MPFDVELKPGVHCQFTGTLYGTASGDNPGMTMKDAPVFISEYHKEYDYPVLLGNMWTKQLGWVRACDLHN